MKELKKILLKKIEYNSTDNNIINNKCIIIMLNS